MDSARINFRQVGRSHDSCHSGRIAKGSTLETQTSPSIPTQYETVINRSVRRKKGFSTSSERFGQSCWPASNSDIVPQSTQNYKLDSFYREKESFSKKGYGVGFVSKAERFTCDRDEEIPGPAAYALDRWMRAIGDSSNRVRYSVKGSSSFLRPRSLEPYKIHRDVPGPGSYNLKSSLIAKAKAQVVRRKLATCERAEKNAFLVSSDRFQKDSNSSDYDPELEEELREKEKSRPHRPAPIRESPMFRRPIREKNDDNGDPGPGPGSYNVGVQTKILASMGQSEIATPSLVVRLAKPPARSIETSKRVIEDRKVASALTPGPGAYYHQTPTKSISLPRNPRLIDAARKVASGGAGTGTFVSRTKRILSTGSNAKSVQPGPGAYNIDGSVKSRKSFRSIRSRHWVGI